MVVREEEGGREFHTGPTFSRAIARASGGLLHRPLPHSCATSMPPVSAPTGRSDASAPPRLPVGPSGPVQLPAAAAAVLESRVQLTSAAATGP